MLIEVRKTETEIILNVIGRFDTTTAPSLEKTITDDVAETDNLVLDLSKLEYVSSAGLRVILGAQKKMQKLGSMKVVNVCDAVMEIFEMTGFADILSIE